MSSGVNLTSWVQGASLFLVGHCSSDRVTIKIPYEVFGLLHLVLYYTIFSCWLVKTESGSLDLLWLT